MNRRRNSGGWPPLPDDTVAVAPVLSVTVSVTASGRAAPSSVLPGPPQVQTNEKAGLAPSCVRVMTFPSVHCAVHEKETSVFVPSGVENDCTVHVVAIPLVMRHSVVGLVERPGSNSTKLAAMPEVAL